MAYHGYVPILQDHLTKLQNKPHVLEVGVDRGVTLIPLVVALASAHDSFFYMGVDIQVQESVKLMVHYLGQSVSQNTFLQEANSLDMLPKLVDANLKFDVMLLDGDHNYHTVSKELTYLNDLIVQGGFVVVDDYDGKWSTRDMWYSERPGYEQNSLATKPQDTQKCGVKPAVDDWLGSNPGWQLIKPIKEGEPVILTRKTS